MQHRRLEYIIGELEEKNYVKVNSLKEKLQVSEVTIRHDLNTLAERGLLKRTHGGAVKIGENVYKNYTKESVYKNVNNKVMIASCAYQFIQNGDTVAIDDSSTCLYLAKKIKEREDKHLTVVTNSVLVATELMNAKKVAVYLVGGQMSGNLESTMGDMTERGFMEFSIDKNFFSTNGVDFYSGISVIGYPQMKIKKAMIKSAKENYLLADSRKFGQKYLSVVGNMEQMTNVITDKEIDEEYRKMAFFRQITITIAGTEKGVAYL